MNIEMIHAAAQRNAGIVRETPMLWAPFLDEIAGRRVLSRQSVCSTPGRSSIAGPGRRFRRWWRTAAPMG